MHLQLNSWMPYTVIINYIVGNILVQPIEEEAQVCHKSINGSVVVAVVGGVGVGGWVQV